MTLRKQSDGSQKRWTYEELKAGLNAYFEEFNRYPTAKEFDSYRYLPSSRAVQKRFGGLVKIRKELGLPGQHDFTKGKHSTNRAKTINKRAHELENKVYKYLKNKFAAEFVHREHQFVDDGRSRTDFFVYDKDGNFSVDVFFAEDRHSLIGCLNTKLRKYNNIPMTAYPVIFLQMNPSIGKETLEDIIKMKKNQLNKSQFLMNWEMFESFCSKRTPHTIRK